MKKKKKELNLKPQFFTAEGGGAKEVLKLETGYECGGNLV